MEHMDNQPLLIGSVTPDETTGKVHEVVTEAFGKRWYKTHSEMRSVELSLFTEPPYFDTRCVEGILAFDSSP